MVKGGMQPLETLLVATSINAGILKETKNIGGIKKGLYADIVAVQGDPVADITFVMKGGIVYKGRK